MVNDSSDELRLPEEVYIADPRSPLFGLNNIHDQYERIKPYSLDENVPKKLVEQYEVARNLFLYAYFVYRFYMVAQHKALITMELAVKEYAGKDTIIQFGREQSVGEGLRSCMWYLKNKKIISNEDFQTWRKRRLMYARGIYMDEKIKEMQEKNIDSIELDYSEIVYEKYDPNWDYVEYLCNSLPSQRNDQSHGSYALFNQVTITFEVVSTIINKLFAQHER